VSAATSTQKQESDRDPWFSSRVILVHSVDKTRILFVETAGSYQ
jgi:hypothetical protein